MSVSEAVPAPELLKQGVEPNTSVASIRDYEDASVKTSTPYDSLW